MKHNIQNGSLINDDSKIAYYLRPHHLLCTYCFVGAGYNDMFVKNYSDMHAVLDQYPEKLIKLVATSKKDKVCGACPNRRSGRCVSEDKVNDIDNKHLKILELKAGDVISYANAKKIIKAKITTYEVFSYTCNTCEWFELGICYKKIFGSVKNA